MPKTNSAKNSGAHLRDEFGDGFDAAKLFEVALRVAMQVQKFLHFVVENVVFLLREFARFDAVNDEHQVFDEVAAQSYKFGELVS